MWEAIHDLDDGVLYLYVVAFERLADIPTKGADGFGLGAFVSRCLVRLDLGTMVSG